MTTMFRPLGPLLRSQQRGLPRTLPGCRGYAVGNSQPVSTSQSEGNENQNGENATPSDSPDRGRFPGSYRRLGKHLFRVTTPQTPKYEQPRRFKVDYMKLRDACTCPRCVDPHSKQRNFRFSDIPQNISARRIQWKGRELVVQWNNDIDGFDESHVSTYDADSLPKTLPYSIGSTRKSEHPFFWTRSVMEKLQHWVTYDEWMNDDAKFAKAMVMLERLGIIFIKDIPNSREMVERIATRMGPLRNTFYGMTWDVRSVPEARNVAYTDKNLGFHMDLMYMKEPPGYQLLHCLKNSCEGGESLFVDTFNAVTKLPPHYFELLTEFKLRYHYAHEDQIYMNQWPVIEALKGEKNGRSQWILQHVNYSPPFQAPFPVASSPKSAEVRREYQKALSAFVRQIEKEHRIFELKLKPGECVIFENRRVAHARRAFDTTSGERWLVGAYVDEDAVMSRLKVLERDHPEWTKVKLVEMVEQKGQDKAHQTGQTEQGEQTQHTQQTQQTP